MELNKSSEKIYVNAFHAKLKTVFIQKYKNFNKAHIKLKTDKITPSQSLIESETLSQYQKFTNQINQTNKLNKNFFILMRNHTNKN